MKILNKKKLVLLFLSFISFVIFSLLSGCSPYGPTLPIESVDDLKNEDIKTAILGLYKRRAADVFLSIETISAMEQGALPAIPYLTSMLADKRLAKKRNYGFVKPAPLFKETALTLGDMGEDGICALVDSLKDTLNNDGIDDDFIREAVALGLKSGKEKWGSSIFKKMGNTDRVIYIINAVSACLELSERPGRFDKFDPRTNLKYYKHFSPLSTREGLKTYIEILGCTGDERALPILSEIAPLRLEPSTPEKLSTLSQPQRAAALAQYNIYPLPLEKINPLIAENLFIELIVRGNIALVGKLLKEGMNPNIQTLTREPVVSLAFEKKHINIFNLLLQKGANLDVYLSKKNTLLIRASGKGDYDFVKILIKNGADLSLKNNAGKTAIDTALKELSEFWDERDTKGKAEPYLKIITLLKNSGSPDANKVLLKSIDKKALKIIGL